MWEPGQEPLCQNIWKLKNPFVWREGFQPFPSYLKTAEINPRSEQQPSSPLPPTMFISVKNSDTAPRHWEANGFFSDEEMFSSSHNNGAFTETYLVTWILLTAVSLHTWEFCQQILVNAIIQTC